MTDGTTTSEVKTECGGHGIGWRTNGEAGIGNMMTENATRDEAPG